MTHLKRLVVDDIGLNDVNALRALSDGGEMSRGARVPYDREYGHVRPVRLLSKMLCQVLLRVPGYY